MILSLYPDIAPSTKQKISHEPFPVFFLFFNKVHNLTFSFSHSLHLALQGYSGPPYLFSLLFLQMPYASPSLHIFPDLVPKRYIEKKTGTPIKEFRSYNNA